MDQRQLSPDSETSESDIILCEENHIFYEVCGHIEIHKKCLRNGPEEPIFSTVQMHHPCISECHSIKRHSLEEDICHYCYDEPSDEPYFAQLFDSEERIPQEVVSLRVKHFDFMHSIGDRELERQIRYRLAEPARMAARESLFKGAIEELKANDRSAGKSIAETTHLLGDPDEEEIISSFSEPDKSKQENCGICREEMSSGVQLLCTHKYHWNCVKDWLLQKDHCPYCRQPYNILETPKFDDYSWMKDGHELLSEMIERESVMRSNFRALYLGFER